MSVNLRRTPVDSIAKRSAGALSPKPDTDATAVNRPHEQRALDWGHVVDAAAARLDEAWVQPDTTGHMLVSGLATELAATLCAYGMDAAEIDHMHAHVIEPEAEPLPPVPKAAE